MGVMRNGPPRVHVVAKRIVKRLIYGGAEVVVAPAYMLYLIEARVLGANAACARSSEWAAKWNGIGGMYCRVALMRHIVRHMGREVAIGFGTVLTKPTITIANDVDIGFYCLLDDVRIGANTLIGDQVSFLSGSRQHGIARLDIPITQQPGQFQVIDIGEDTWIGVRAVILSSVGNHCVVGAGSVVTKPVPDYAIVAGNPARPIGDRRTIRP